MTDYQTAMADLNDAIYTAHKAARNEDGAPVQALLNILCDIDSLIDHGLTVAEYKSMRSLYDAEKRAGLLDSPEEAHAKLKDAGRL